MPRHDAHGLILGHLEAEDARFIGWAQAIVSLLWFEVGVELAVVVGVAQIVCREWEFDVLQRKTVVLASKLSFMQARPCQLTPSATTYADGINPYIHALTARLPTGTSLGVVYLNERRLRLSQHVFKSFASLVFVSLASLAVHAGPVSLPRLGLLHR